MPSRVKVGCGQDSLGLMGGFGAVGDVRTWCTVQNNSSALKYQLGFGPTGFCNGGKFGASVNCENVREAAGVLGEA